MELLHNKNIFKHTWSGNTLVFLKKKEIKIIVHIHFHCDPHKEVGMFPDHILFMFDVQRMGFVAKVHGNVLCGHLPEFPLLKAI